MPLMDQYCVLYLCVRAYVLAGVWKAGKFSVVPLMVNLASGLALLGVVSDYATGM